MFEKTILKARTAGRPVRDDGLLSMTPPLLLLLLALDLAGCYEPSPENLGDAPPSTPSSLRVGRSSETSFDVSWGEVAGASMYELRRDTDRSGAFEHVVYNAGGRSCKDSGLDSGTTYYYKVAASNAFGSSPYSDAAGESTPPMDLIVTWNNQDMHRGEFGILDKGTGATSFIGPMGDLDGWIRQAIIVESMLFVFGLDAAGQNNLYAMDIRTGELVGQVPTGPYTLTLAGPHGGDFIVIWGNTSTSTAEYGALDPETGGVVTRGEVGDLTSWINQATVDGDRLYVVGNDPASQGKLYVLDIPSGELLREVPTGPYTLAIAGMHEGDLIVMWGTMAMSIMQFGTLDTETGETTARGDVGDLVYWLAKSMIWGDTLLTIGGNSTDQWKLYAIDLVTDGLISAVNLSRSDLVLVGAYAR